jgi:hypothetical protein
MNIPFQTPIRFDKWEEDIKEQTKIVRDKNGFTISGLVMHPETISEVMNYQSDHTLMNQYSRISNGIWFAGYKLIGNSDLKQYEYRLEVAYV